MNTLSKPKFFPHQIVRFIGGVGKIKSIERQDSRWTYTIEMSMGKKTILVESAEKQLFF